MRSVRFVVPDGIGDPSRPTGGNIYDRRLSRELAASGWTVLERSVPGFWSRPGAAALAALARVLDEAPDGTAVLLDGLIASTAPEVLTAHAGRLWLVVLVHMSAGHRPAEDGARAREGAALSCAAAVVTTSAWSRQRLLELYGLDPGRIHVAEPGVDLAEPAAGTPAGEALLCVAAVTREKGHDVLLDALATIGDLSWRCVCAGGLEREAAFAEDVRRRSLAAPLDGRVRFAGTLTGTGLDRAYEAADLLVLPSRAETYGMVVIEALARGLPVVAADVGGVREALGDGSGGTRPGMLVAPEDPAALGAALRAWLADAGLRRRLRAAARERRDCLPRWEATASAVAGVLAGVSR